MSARGLLIGGALLAGLSIMLPWYEIQLFGVDESVSGYQAREQACIALIILAAVACGGFNVRREVTPLAAAAVAVIVAACIVSVPGVPAPEPEAGAFFTAYSLTFEFSRTWGLWVAAVGAGAMLVGAARLARA